MVEQFLGEVAVRVEEGQSVPQMQVLQNHVPQQRCFPRTRFADDVGVMSGVFTLDAEGDLLSPALALADVNGAVAHGA